ncbi:MAG: hypothetical protein MUF42_12515 [Cytophagaceae bacterium]|jgi:hypothetical protein|nr:hypothetical protein [Cytophagaceae bacterium]
MKKFTILSLVGVAFAAVLTLTAFTSEKTTANNNAPYILLEIYEIPTYEDRGIHIHYGGNKREVIPFPFEKMTKESHDEAGDLILNSINKLVADGYHIEHTAAGLSPAGMITKIFMRKK